jgi:hypothetical protein
LRGFCFFSTIFPETTCLLFTLFAVATIFIPSGASRDRNKRKEKLKMATLSQAIESANALICSGQGIISVEIEFVTKAGISFRGIWNGLTFERLERIEAA